MHPIQQITVSDVDCRTIEMKKIGQFSIMFV